VRSRIAAVVASLLVSLACGGGSPKVVPPKAETVPWSRLSGKLAVVQDHFDLANGFTAPSEVFVLDATRQTVVTVKRFEASEGVFLLDPVWSADGRTILFETMQGGATRRRAVAVDGSDVALPPPLDDAATQHLTWTRDGRLAYCRAGSVSIDGAAAVADTACSKGFAWSPDGRTVVVTGYPDGYAWSARSSFLPAVWSVTLASGDSRLLFLAPNPPTPQDLLDHAFSPDGTRIAFTLQFDSGLLHSAIWTVSADGASAQAVTSGDLEHSPVWSPDGRQIAYGSRSTGLMLVNADGASPVSLGFGGNIAWSP
jgi:Tol biopolymer transport system component